MSGSIDPCQLTALELQNLIDTRKELCFQVDGGELRARLSEGYFPIVGTTQFYVISFWKPKSALFFPFKRAMEELPNSVEFFSPLDKAPMISAFQHRLKANHEQRIGRGAWAPPEVAHPENCQICGSLTTHGRERQRQNVVQSSKRVDFGKPIHELLSALRDRMLDVRDCMQDVRKGTTWGNKLTDIEGTLNVAAGQLQHVLSEVRRVEMRSVRPPRECNSDE